MHKFFPCAAVNAKREFWELALKVYTLKKPTLLLPLQPNDASAIIEYANGKKRKEEFYYGNSFLSQSARFISFNEQVKLITIIDQKGQARKNNY